MEERTIIERGGPVSLSLGTIGVITGIVLSVLQGIEVIDIGRFWATFPFWIIPAIDLAIVILVGIVCCIIGFVSVSKDYGCLK